MPKKDITVEPLEAVSETASQEADGEDCWNCLNQGEYNKLSKKGSCKVCGFQKDTLYNGTLEAVKADERRAAMETAFNKNIVR